MLLRLAYLSVTNAFALLHLLPMSDRDKDVEILVLRHQITVLERQLGKTRPRFSPSDRAFLAALLHRLPPEALRRFRLLIRPETVLRWHRDLLARRHAAKSRPKRAGRPRTVRSIRLLVLRLARENPTWGYRRIHGELLVLEIKVAASTVWQILKDAGIDPAPDRTSTTWADFLRSQAEALLACDFFEVATLSGTRLYVLAVIEHNCRRIRILGATAHPTAAWVAQAAKNLVMDLDDAGSSTRFLIRDRDGKFPALFDAILADAGVQIVLSGVRIPRMNAIMERWIKTCRHELLDRMLIWNQQHLLHALREYEQFYNTHRPHQGIANARPLHPLPPPITDQAQITDLDIRRRQRLGGILSALRQARRFAEAIRVLQNAATIHRRAGNLDGEAQALTNLGAALLEAMRLEEADLVLQAASVICDRTGDQHAKAQALNNLGLVCRRLGKPSEAISAHSKAVEIYRATSDLYREGSALNNLGAALSQAGRFAEAIEAHRRDLEICRKLEDRHGEAGALNNLGGVLQRNGRADEAVDLHARAVAIFREFSDIHAASDALINMVHALVELHRYQEAGQYWNEAIELLGDSEVAEAMRRLVAELPDEDG